MNNTPQSMSEEELRKKLEDQLRVAYTWGLRAGVLSEADKPKRAESDGKGLMQGVDEFMSLITQYSLTKQLEAYQHGLMTGTMPEAFGKPIAEDYIAAIKHQLGKDK